jgi:hypothetical protein
MDDVDPSHDLEQLRRQVHRRAVAGRTVGELPGIGLCSLHDVLDGLEGAVRLDDQHVGAGADQSYADEVLLGLVRKLLDQRIVDRQRRCREQQGIAVGRGLGHQVGTDYRTCTGLVVDDDGLAQETLHVFCKLAADDVGAAAGGERNDHPDRARRKVVGREVYSNRPRTVIGA